MKKVLLSLISFALLALAGGCTRNNGDIGSWFGTWQMTAVTVDGQPVASYQRNIFWKFQNKVLMIVEVSTDPVAHTWDRGYASWAEDDDVLTVNFTATDDFYPDPVEGNIYTPLGIPGMTYGNIYPLKIVSRSGNRVILINRSTADGKEYTYTIEEQG